MVFLNRFLYTSFCLPPLASASALGEAIAKVPTLSLKSLRCLCRYSDSLLSPILGDSGILRSLAGDSRYGLDVKAPESLLSPSCLFSEAFSLICPR